MWGGIARLQLIPICVWLQVYEGYDMWGEDRVLPDFRNYSISYHGPTAGRLTLSTHALHAGEHPACLAVCRSTYCPMCSTCKSVRCQIDPCKKVQHDLWLGPKHPDEHTFRIESGLQAVHATRRALCGRWR